MLGSVSEKCISQNITKEGSLWVGRGSNSWERRGILGMFLPFESRLKVLSWNITQLTPMIICNSWFWFCLDKKEKQRKNWNRPEYNVPFHFSKSRNFLKNWISQLKNSSFNVLRTSLALNVFFSQCLVAYQIE